LVDLHSLPEDDVPVAEQSLPDASSGGLLALPEGNAVSGSATGEEQPSGRIERRWELEYTVPVRGPNRKNFEL
jgi:hypothetical protein